MRTVLQRVSFARVSVNNEVVGEIKEGIMALVGINKGDDEAVFKYMFDKISGLRIFCDENDKMNLSVKDINGGILIVPNFTIYADARKGKRPSFVGGATPEEAEGIFNSFLEYCKKEYENVESGIFRADMKVELLNDGPVTILLDSDKLF